MCVHFRYGPMCVVLEAFPGSLLSAFPYLPKLSVCIAPSPYAHRISLVRRYLACPSYSSDWLPEPSPSLHRHTSGTGISTCRPSATPFGLALGPDYPREDEPSSETLGHRCVGFSPTCRYSRRHSLFHALHMPSRSCFSAACNAPLPHSCP